MKCSENWYEKGPSNNTICEKCSHPEIEPEDEQLSDDFEDLVKGMLYDEEKEELRDMNWEDVKMLAAEHAAMQLRWKILITKKRSVD